MLPSTNKRWVKSYFVGWRYILRSMIPHKLFLVKLCNTVMRHCYRESQGCFDGILSRSLPDASWNRRSQIVLYAAPVSKKGWTNADTLYQTVLVYMQCFRCHEHFCRRTSCPEDVRTCKYCDRTYYSSCNLAGQCEYCCNSACFECCPLYGCETCGKQSCLAKQCAFCTGAHVAMQ